MANICIVLPNNSTSVFLGQHLVSELNHVSFFVPNDGPHEAAASTFYEEVKICAAGLSANVKKFRNAFKCGWKLRPLNLNCNYTINNIDKNWI